MKKSLFAFRNGEPNPIYITELTEKEVQTEHQQLEITLHNARFEIMECLEDKGDLKQELFYSYNARWHYKHKEGMIFERV